MFEKISNRKRHYILSFLIQILLAGLFFHDWDGFVFLTSAKQLLSGISPYVTVTTDPAYIYAPFPPMTQMWYAYPPLPVYMFGLFYGIYALIGSNLILGRLFIKLPFILGNLICANLAYKITGSSKIEKLILYNPFLIFIAAVWGMFDIWILVFLLLTVMKIDKPALSGFYFGLAVLVKILPVVFAPLFLINIWKRTKDIKNLFRFILSSVAVFFIVSLPFLITTPKSYINQVLFIHMQRPPQELAFFGLLYADAILDYLIGGFTVEFIYTTLPKIFTVLFFGSILLLFVHYWIKNDISKSGLLNMLFIGILLFLLLNKVVNPQYFVIPIALSIILLFNESIHRVMTYAMLTIGIFAGCHFAMFVPMDISVPIFGWSLINVFSDAITQIGIPLDIFYALTLIVSLGAFYIMLYGIIGVLWKELKTDVFTLYGRVLSFEKNSTHRKTVILAALTIMIIPFGVLLSTDDKSLNTDLSSYNADDKLVGVFYYIWWNNPSHDPAIKVDSWKWSSVTPLEGFYESTRGYMEQDIQQMKEVGIDFVVVSFHDYGQDRQKALVEVCEENNVRYAPFIELLPIRYINPEKHAAISSEGDFFSMYQLGFRKNTKEKIIDLLDSALEYSSSESYLRIDNKPVVFIYDDHQFHPGWSDEEKEYMVDGLYLMKKEQYSISNDGGVSTLLTERWSIDIDSKQDAMNYYPTDILEFYNPQTIIEHDWVDAYNYNWKRFWEDIQETVENEYGEVSWMGNGYRGETIGFGGNIPENEFTVMDANFYYSLGCIFQANWRNQTRGFEIWDEMNSNLYRYSKEYNFPLIISVIPYYDDRYIRENEPINLGHPVLVNETLVGGSLYNYTWEKAYRYNASIVLISTWNEHYETSGIEPTVEFGTKYLDETTLHIEKFRR